ncbi:MAG: hypothetical protein ACK6CE_00420 [Planctomycetota bacterium]
MNEFPFGYERIQETSWAYLSALLMLALFYKFNRFWTMRNLDLLLLILLAPGLLMVYHGERMPKGQQVGGSTAPAAVVPRETNPSPTPTGGSENAPPNGPANQVSSPGGGSTQESTNNPGQGALPSAGVAAPPGAQSAAPPGATPVPAAERPAEMEPTPMTELTAGQRLQRAGYIWLLAVGGIFLVRLLIDPLLVRKPMLEPNLSIGGLVFLGCSLMIFSFADIITAAPGSEDLEGAIGAVRMVKREAIDSAVDRQLLERGPGYPLLHVFPVIWTFSGQRSMMKSDTTELAALVQMEMAAKAVVIFSHILMVVGIIALGHYHFSNFRNGVGMAVIYLMLPHTSLYAGHVMHLLPGVLILWAVVMFRQPMVAGVMLGLATGVAYYPFFLLPLWVSFYWERGAGRFVAGMLAALAVCIAGLLPTSPDAAAFMAQLKTMFGFWLPRMQGLEGIWSLGWDPWFRIPVLVAFITLSVSFVFWPARKSLGTLIAYTSAVMVAVQFWHGYSGGVYLAWYVPLALAIFFRPNLSDRLAANELNPGWAARRKLRIDGAQNVLNAA